MVIKTNIIHSYSNAEYYMVSGDMEFLFECTIRLAVFNFAEVLPVAFIFFLLF